MLELPDVTLCCIHTVAHELTQLALKDCLKHARFGDVQVYTEKDMGTQDYAEFTNYEFPKRVKTSHMLNFQWDGWIINPDAWTDEFLQYDWIGAPWWYSDGMNVGNSGFCLRSREFMDYLSRHRDEFPIKQPDDHTICREYRKRLTQFKWAPDALAYRFSIERTFPPMLTPFGFHGIFNWPFVLTDEQIEERLAHAPQYVCNKPEFWEMQNIRQRHFHW